MHLEGAEESAALTEDHILVGHECLLKGSALLRCQFGVRCDTHLSLMPFNRFLLRRDCMILILLFCDDLRLNNNLWRLYLMLRIAAANEVYKVRALKQSELTMDLSNLLFAVLD